MYGLGRPWQILGKANLAKEKEKRYLRFLRKNARMKNFCQSVPENTYHHFWRRGKRGEPASGWEKNARFFKNNS